LPCYKAQQNNLIIKKNYKKKLAKAALALFILFFSFFLIFLAMLALTVSMKKIQDRFTLLWQRSPDLFQPPGSRVRPPPLLWLARVTGFARSHHRRTAWDRGIIMA
jgi:hypothetical protein